MLSLMKMEPGVVTAIDFLESTLNGLMDTWTTTAKKERDLFGIGNNSALEQSIKQLLHPPMYFFSY